MSLHTFNVLSLPPVTIVDLVGSGCQSMQNIGPLCAMIEFKNLDGFLISHNCIKLV